MYADWFGPWDDLALDQLSMDQEQYDNIIAEIRGTERPDEYVLYTAHWDHLGMDPDPDAEDRVFNGAVDNATGTAGILEIAEAMASVPVLT